MRRSRGARPALPAVHFKGSGFYNTDYGKKKKGGANGGGSEGVEELEVELRLQLIGLEAQRVEVERLEAQGRDSTDEPAT